MPRLVGKKSNPALYIGLGLVIAAAGAVGLEYYGVVNYVPNFGKETTVNETIRTPAQINRTVN